MPVLLMGWHATSNLKYKDTKYNFSLLPWYPNSNYWNREGERVPKFISKEESREEIRATVIGLGSRRDSLDLAINRKVDK